MKSPRVVAAVLVRNKEGKFLLAKETLEDGNEYWLIPGGKVKFGETIKQAAIRELKEEFGIEVELESFVGFHEAVFPRYNYHSIIFFFTGIAKNEPKFVKEAIEARFFSIDEIKNLNLVSSAKWCLEKLGFI